MSDVFKVFENDVQTAKVPGLGLVDFVRWQTVVDKWPVAPAIPPDVRDTMRETIQRERDSLARHTNERKQYYAIYKRWPDGDDSLVTRWTDKLSRYDAALSWLDAQGE